MSSFGSSMSKWWCEMLMPWPSRLKPVLWRVEVGVGGVHDAFLSMDEPCMMRAKPTPNPTFHPPCHSPLTFALVTPWRGAGGGMSSSCSPMHVDYGHECLCFFKDSWIGRYHTQREGRGGEEGGAHRGVLGWGCTIFWVIVSPSRRIALCFGGLEDHLMYYIVPCPCLIPLSLGGIDGWGGSKRRWGSLDGGGVEGRFIWILIWGVCACMSPQSMHPMHHLTFKHMCNTWIPCALGLLVCQSV